MRGLALAATVAGVVVGAALWAVLVPVSDAPGAAAAAAATFVRDDSLTTVSNPNAPELTVDAAGGRATWDHCCDGGKWKVAHDWVVPGTLTTGEQAAVTLGLAVSDVDPEQPLYIQMSMRAPDSSQALGVNYPDQAADRKTYSFPISAGYAGANELTITIQVVSAEITYRYRRVATPPQEDTTVVTDTAGVGALRGTVLFRVNGGPWRPLTTATRLGKGAEVSTDIDAEVTLTFSDGSRMTLDEMTEVFIEDLLASGSRQAVAVQLKMGELAAKVNPKKAFQTDFKVQTIVGTTSSRGTVFSVFSDAVAKASIVSTSEGSVEVDPVRRGLPTRIVSAGREVELTAKAISRLAKRGRAGTRGGVNRRRARELVAKLLRRSRKRCALAIPESPSAVAVKPARGGWLVSVRVAGKAKGKATFGVARRKARPKNALAKKIARRCR